MDKVILFTYFLLTTLVSQVLPLATPVGKGSTSVSSVNVSAAMVTSSMVIFCCATECMILTSENKHFHNVFVILFVPLISIFEEPACRRPNHWGNDNFVSIFPSYSHDIFLHPKQPGEQPLGNFLEGVPEIMEENSQLAHLSLPEYLQFPLIVM